jgi:Xaa-Pro dipeptidase
MVITIEPGIYLEGELGVRIEDTIIVGKNNAEIIGNLPYNI